MSDHPIMWRPRFLDLTPTNLGNIHSFHPGWSAA